MTVMVLNNREAIDKPKSYIHSPYSSGKRHLVLYLLYIESSEICDTDFFFLMLVILLKLMGVNMDKSYWTAVPNVH